MTLSDLMTSLSQTAVSNKAFLTVLLTIAVVNTSRPRIGYARLLSASYEEMVDNSADL